MADSLNTMIPNVATMSSREIADICGARHNDVVETIERLFEQGVLRESRKTTRTYRPEGGGRPTEVYDLTKRDTLVVVSGYNADVRAKIIDRWMELEAAQAQPAIPSHAEALRLAADLMDKQAILINTVMVKDKELSVAKPKAEALDKLATLEGTHNLRSAAQQCGWPEREFVKKLVALRWLYTHSVTGRKCAYADKIKAGLMEAKNVEVKRTGYVEGVGQPMITQKGLAALRVQIGAYLSPEAQRPFAKKGEPAMT